MGWRIVEINTTDNLKLFLNNLSIKRGERKLLINVSDIDVLIIDNIKINMSIPLINAITDKNGIIVVLNNFHIPSSYIFNVVGHHTSLKIFHNQLKWTNRFKSKTWQEIIRNKIYNQMNLLIKFKANEIDHEYFDKLINDVKGFDITNREGHASKVYWHLLFGLNFIRDYKAKQCTSINRMLNYGYAVLRSLVIKSIIKKGLDPRIAFFHKSHTNFFALASDIMEPLRIIVDEVVFENKDTEEFTREIKEKIIKALTGKVFFNGKWEFINNAIDKCMDNLTKGRDWEWILLWK